MNCDELESHLNWKKLTQASPTRNLWASFFLCLPLAVALAGSIRVAKLEILGLYALDLLLVVSLIGVLATLQPTINPLPKAYFWRRILVLSFVPLAALGALLNGEINRTSLRDAHPFLMVGLAAIVVLLVPRLSRASLAFASRMILVSLVFHWLSVTILLVAREQDGSFLINQTLLGLQLRPDIDAAILGVTSGVVYLLGLSKRPRYRWIFVVLAVGIQVQVGQLGSRAGQIAALVTLTTACLIGLSKRFRGDRSHPIVELLVAILAPIVSTFLVLSLTTVGLKTLPIIGSESAIAAQSDERTEASQLNPISVDAFHTAEARIDTASALLRWLIANPRELVFGVGFGTDYFYESGARSAMMGEASPVPGENRWPHNFLLTSLAMMGAVTTLLLVFIGGLSMLKGIQGVIRKRSPTHAFGVMLFLAVGVAGMFGVVIENPFGSVPIAYAIGICLSLPLASKQTHCATLES